LFKDIVQLKRWGSKGIPVDSHLIPTQSAMFLATPKVLLSCLKFEKTSFRVNKGGILFDVECAIKNLEVH
jgi:hypothetical protein